LVEVKKEKFVTGIAIGTAGWTVWTVLLNVACWWNGSETIVCARMMLLLLLLLMLTLLLLLLLLLLLKPV
jgi:hypothetical protein